MDRRTTICLWVIVIGLANFFAYTVSYAVIDGEAVNGVVENHQGQLVYKLSGDHDNHAVSRTTFVYSGLHSISIWPTVMAVLLAMLTLAKDRIAGSMRSSIERGRSLCTVLAIITAISMAGMTFLFVRKFARTLENPVPISAPAQPGSDS
jgi:hypothetical protein